MLSSIFTRALRLHPPCSNNLLLTRDKHSSTQLKRLFQKHPARARVEQRLGINQPQEIVFDEPRYPPVFEPNMLSNGWSAPPPSNTTNSDGSITSTIVQSYPFQVQRTKNKPMDAVGFLPVYAKYRKDGTKAVTLIKKVSGNVDVFLKELESNLHVPVSEMRIRTGGAIEIAGNRVPEVKLWLAKLGF